MNGSEDRVDVYEPIVFACNRNAKNKNEIVMISQIAMFIIRNFIPRVHILTRCGFPYFISVKLF